MAGKHVARSQDQRAAQEAYQDEQIQDLQAQQQQQAYAPAPAAAAPAAPSSDESFEQLQKLGQMHEQGVLTDEEFAAAKAKILKNL
jgi:hypothetical protein